MSASYPIRTITPDEFEAFTAVPEHAFLEDADADLVLSAHVNGAGYLGGASLGQHAAAGHVSERTPGSLGRLAAAMSWDPRPWCSMMF